MIKINIKKCVKPRYYLLIKQFNCFVWMTHLSSLWGRCSIVLQSVFKQWNILNKTVFAMKSWEWKQRVFRSRSFGGQINKCTQTWAVWSHWLLKADCSLQLCKMIPLITHTSWEGGGGLPQPHGWLTNMTLEGVCVCVCVRVWGPVGKYLFVLLFVSLLPPFIAYKSADLCVSVWVVLLCACVSDLSGSLEWKEVFGNVVSLNTQYQTN